MTLPSDAKTCKCCETKRESEQKDPRLLIPVFMDKGEDPIYMCPNCDGDALDMAKELESDRMSDA